MHAEGIDPDLALTTIKSKLTMLFQFKESPTDQPETVGETKSSTTVFPGILAAVEKLGYGIKQLADMTGLSEIFILRLDRRLIALEGRSKSIASLIADKLHFDVSAIQDYILGKSLYPAEVNFKAEALPEISKKQPFDEAVNSDRIMSEETKAFLLSLQDEK